MFKSLFSFLSGAMSVLNKLLPSWEWKGGVASAEAKAAKKGLEDAKRAARIKESVGSLTADERDRWLRDPPKRK